VPPNAARSGAVAERNHPIAPVSPIQCGTYASNAMRDIPGLEGRNCPYADVAQG
jgi:hypothetical protein